MKGELLEFSYEVEILPGEKLALPPALLENLRPGRWVIEVHPARSSSRYQIRDHAAFLASYSPDDEGLYEDAPTG